MTLESYTAQLRYELSPRTVVFLVREGRVLLGYKKSGFGKGKYVGIGGKVGKNESLDVASVREVQEETSITPLNLQLRAVLRFYFPHIEDESWNQEVYAFVTDQWDGEPIESDEVRPEWIDVDNMPYQQMWSDAPLWIPQILSGRRLEGDFLFDQDLLVTDYEMR